VRDQVKIAFVLSHACPLKCDFCCSTREVVGPKRLRRRTIEDCLIAFAAEPAVTDFGFTGGDPFLYIRDIKAALAAARKAGVWQPFQMTTSAYWAKDRDQVRAALAELVDLGLNRLTLSYDHEHARWVSGDRILMACDIAGEMGVSVYVAGTFWSEHDRVEDMLPELASRAHVTPSSHVVAPIGRAKKAAWPRRYAVPLEQKLSCGDPGSYIFTIYPDGEVYPCCSGGLQIEGKLSCGNVQRDTPAQILFAGVTNFHVRMAKEFGWGVLYALVEREAPELRSALPRFEDVDSPCQICRDLNLGLRDRLAPIYHIIEREYARARAEQEWRAKSGQRRVGERFLSLSDFLDLMDEDRGIRLDYLSGALQIGTGGARAKPATVIA
jgi:MoaA/NifB/PqqE/SkfB family radical SAM enzyme